MPNISKVRSLLPSNKVTTRGGSKKQTPSAEAPQENSLSLGPIITPSPLTIDTSTNSSSNNSSNNFDDQGHGSHPVWPDVT